MLRTTDDSSVSCFQLWFNTSGGTDHPDTAVVPTVIFSRNKVEADAEADAVRACCVGMSHAPQEVGAYNNAAKRGR